MAGAGRAATARPVLRHTGGKFSPAARLMGIHRATLRGRLAALGIDPSEPAPDDADEG